MFELRLTPNFSSQKRKLLEQKSVPHLSLPPETESCLNAIAHWEPSSVKGSRVIKSREIWVGTFKSTRGLMIRAGTVSLLISICAASSTLFAMQILKSAQSGEGLGTGRLLLLSLGFFAMNVFSQFWTLKIGSLRAWISLSAEAYLVGLLSHKLLRLSSLAAAQQNSGNLKVLVTSDVKNVGLFLDNMVRNLVPSLAALFVIGPLLIYFSGSAGFFGMSILLLIIPISLALNSISEKLQTKSQYRLDEMASLVGEWMKNVRLIRYLSWDEGFAQDVAERVSAFMRVSVMQHLMACLIFGMSSTWWMVSLTGALLMARWLGLAFELQSFFGSLWLLTFLASYLTHLPNTIRYWGMAAPSVRRIARLLAEEEQLDRLQEGEADGIGGSPSRLILDQVSFAYSNEKPLIKGLSLEIDLNRKLAIIGEIGSGKTTLLKLLAGELAPVSGSIQVEFKAGARSDLWARETYHAYRECLAYVPQEPFVSNDLLGRNISLSTSTHEAEIVEAAYWAELEADISLFPQGFSQEIGEGGVNLSGGQRQRLNLARARHSKRQFLLLDDTLSAVDTRTERLLMERLSGLKGGFVLVTHRVRELMRVDEVLVLRDGVIVERGAPAELAQRRDSHFTRVLRAYEEEGADV